MPAGLRSSPQTHQVLASFLDAPRRWHYGYDISRATGLKSGTLYPILMRLADRDLLDTRWEPSQTGRPPRHLYRLTAAGVRVAREYVVPRSHRATRRLAFDG
ncbi:MAG TPA: PadR family transcriptional regulator [Vicinamibacterales bacterium]|nr:PadR family transcriptional regulator [Vicinamibacterales bacterium]